MCCWFVNGVVCATHCLRIAAEMREVSVSDSRFTDCPAESHHCIEWLTSRATKGCLLSAYRLSVA